MALTTVEPPVQSTKSLAPPPDVITTPCDPWPRPYYLEDNLRRVAPYHFTYNTNVKERWRGRELLDIFREEFRDRPEEYYKDAIDTGKIQVNGQSSTRIAHVKNGDVISHTLHRHEPPVTAQPIGIVHEDDDMIVINKPAGVPVHPAGRYNYNSVVEIMRAQRGHQWNPLPCNRLDRLTSGVMFIGKHKKAAEALTEQLMGRTVRKEYVARVRGEFPAEDVVCEQPILQISPKLGLNRVRANGKQAKTVFKRLAYYPPKPPQPNTDIEEGPSKQGYSIVRCLPLTGRTHQLRVHLQFLGHPISNDPIYANRRVFGSALGHSVSTSDDDEDIMTRLARMGKDEIAEAVAYEDEMVADYNAKKAEKMTGELCEICDTPLYSDPGPHELGIYLHAKKYADADGRWGYETPLPAWALPPEGAKGPVEVTSESDPAKFVQAEVDFIE
ncbi:DRAP deaminase [Recurvomyces mirabilis]|uniref:Pseudouridine synthase n=1 Tax=Recurvomyces mirabilis TaxID=574656 RepID=A0AAE0WXQ3_9PEZI|nr:DRAP deaminase [Recurvomyces mirabilis]KAK5161996.1 DRAP deaminase [Recurvomyces mirabilis]